MEKIEIVDTSAGNIHEYGMCGYTNMKHEGYRRKIEWVKQRFSEGLKYKILYSDKDGAVGGIEYIPGEYTWRSVEAHGYMVIHCIYIMSRKYKGKGHGELMLQECLEDAQKRNMHGVAVVTRKGTWMAGKELFIKNDFEIVDRAPPDFKLLAIKMNRKATSPKFKGDWEQRLRKYDKGLVIFSSEQCPYIPIKAVEAIRQTAATDYGIQPKIVELKNCREAQNMSPCALGSFCLVYNGKVIADHPISNTRFKNIMNKILQ